MDREAVAAALDRVVPPLAAAGGWPGAIVAVRAGGETAAWATGAVRAGDAFRIASVTKAFTAVTALRIAEGGAISLDEPVAEHLGPRTRRLLGRLAGDGRPTLRHLLGHTSGLRDYFSDPSFSEQALRPGAGPWQPHQLLEVAGALGPPLSGPGQGFSYGDTGYVVAALVLEQVTGLALADLYRTYVTSPLGLADTHLEGHEPGTRIAPHYDGDRDLTGVDMTFDWGGGGLVSTAADLARFIAACLDGELLGREALEELTSWEPRTRFAPGSTAVYERYALGVGAIRAAGVELVGATGVWGAFAFWARELQIGLAGTINMARVDRRPLLDAITGALVPLVGGP